MSDGEMNGATMTREKWLGAGVNELRGLFQHVGSPLPDIVHASIGFPSRGALSRTRRVIGQCWAGENSSDGNCQIFISPLLVTPFDILDTLTHELAHVVTPGAGHKGKFITVAKALGLTEGKPRSAAAGPQLRDLLEKIALEIGPLSHPALTAAMLAATPQATRMLKCECSGCGYVARTTQKWLDVGAPICPSCEISMEAV